MTTKTTRPVSKHDVFAEFEATCGEQAHNQNEYFIQTMTDEDIRKITSQLLDKWVNETSVFEADNFIRTLESIEKKRAFGKLSHLRN